MNAMHLFHWNGGRSFQRCRRLALLAAVLCFATFTGAALAQSAAAASAPATAIPKFEVISVRQDKLGGGWRDGSTADGYSAKNVTLQWMLPEAYGIRQDYRIFGTPAWAGTDRYDIEAKVAESDIPALAKLDSKQRNSMIQQILADRFAMKAHVEDRSQPIYSLVVMKKERLHETPPPVDGTPASPFSLVTRSRPGRLTVTGITMAGFANIMSGNLGRFVVDGTDLTSRYDIKLDWDPNYGASSSGDSGQPSIFTALQEQLGLKLVPGTGPVQCLVIDQVELPSEN